MKVEKDKNFLRLCRLYPSVFQIDNYQHFVDKNVDNTTNSCIYSEDIEDYITLREPLDVRKLRTVGNVRVKKYADGSCDILVCSDDIFKRGEMFGREVRESKYLWRDNRTGELREDCRILQWSESDRPELIGFDDCPGVPCTPSSDSIRRAQARLKELLLSNSFDWFVTLTLNGAKIDRYDYSAVINPLSKWLDNRVQRRGWTYVFVPEFHKDGAIHLHGVVAGDLRAVDSGTVKVHGKKKPVRMSTYRRYYSGQAYSTIYNLPDWSIGYSTAVRLDEKRHAVAQYIGKYITKDSKKVGGRWYLSGGALKRADISIFRGNFIDFAEVFKIFGIDGRSERFCAFRLSSDGEVFGTFNRR